MSVKVKKRGRPTANTTALSAQTIIDQAKALMQQAGATPSIRKLAAHLDVDAMAIYYYFKKKETLMQCITLSLIEELYEPQPKKPWQDELRTLCNSYLVLMSRYSGLLESWLSAENHEPAIAFAQRSFVHGISHFDEHFVFCNLSDMKGAFEFGKDFVG